MQTVINPYGNVLYVGNLNEHFELHGKGSIFTVGDKKNHIWTGIFTNNIMSVDRKPQNNISSYCVSNTHSLKNIGSIQEHQKIPSSNVGSFNNPHHKSNHITPLSSKRASEYFVNSADLSIKSPFSFKPQQNNNLPSKSRLEKDNLCNIRDSTDIENECSKEEKISKEGKSSVSIIRERTSTSNKDKKLIPSNGKGCSNCDARCTIF